MEIISKVIYALESDQTDLCVETAKHGGPDIGRACVRYLLENSSTSLSNDQMEISHRHNNGDIPSLLAKLKNLSLITDTDVLFEACRNGNFEVVKELIKENPQFVDYCDNYCYGFTALHWACQSGSEEICKLILDARSPSFDINKQETKFQSTALHMAYYTGKVGIYSAILSAGAKTNISNKFGETCLHLAAKAGYAECCKLLIEHGADVLAVQKNGNTPLHWAAMHKLKPNSDGSEPITHPVCSVLIQAGAKVDFQNRDRATALHIASKKGNIPACATLIAANASVNIKDKNCTPLQYASYNGHLKVCEILLEAGADATAIDNKFGTALHFAAYGGNAKVCKLLIEHSNSLLDTKNNSGKTAHDVAEEKEDSEIVEILASVKQAKKQRNGSISS